MPAGLRSVSLLTQLQCAAPQETHSATAAAVAGTVAANCQACARCDRWTCCHGGTTQPCCCSCCCSSLNTQDGETHRDLAHAATAAAAQACCCASSCCHCAPASAAAAAHSCSGIVMCLNSFPAFRPSQTFVTTASMPCSSRRARGRVC